MPKLKSKKGTKKRIKITKTGKVKYGKANKRHILTSKPRKRKRQNKGTAVLAKADQNRIRELLPYGNP